MDDDDAQGARPSGIGAHRAGRRPTPPPPPPPPPPGEGRGARRSGSPYFRPVLLSIVAVLAVVAIIGVIELTGHDDQPGRQVATHSPTTPARTTAPAGTSGPSTPTPTKTTPTKTGPSAHPSGSATSAAPAPSSPVAVPAPSAGHAVTRYPLTVLNNSRIAGLADRAAAEYRAAGWPVKVVGNYRGRIAETTVYYAAGQEAAARELAREFSGITRVKPRFAGLPGSGLTVVLTRQYYSS